MASEMAATRRAGPAKRGRPGNCEREADTIRAAWGEEAGGVMDQELAAHLAACPGCAEVAALSRTFRAERDAARAEANPPSAGLVWWRAQRRARAEAAREAARPIALIHAVALGCTAAAAVAILSIGFGGFKQWMVALGVRLSDTALPALPGLTVRAGETGWALPYGAMLVLAALLVLAPIAIYLAVSEK